MQLFEKRVSVPAAPGNKDLIKHIENALSFRLVDGEVPIRLAITAIDNGQYNCEVGCIVSGLHFACGEGAYDAPGGAVVAAGKGRQGHRDGHRSDTGLYFAAHCVSEQTQGGG